MTELSFTARQLSSSADGMKTTFRFTDGRGHHVAVSFNGEVGSDFVDHCRIYYEPNPPVHRFAGIDEAPVAPDPPDRGQAFSEPEFLASFEDIDIVDAYETTTSWDIARSLEWEFVRILPETFISAGMLR